MYSYELIYNSIRGNRTYFSMHAQIGIFYDYYRPKCITLHIIYVNVTMAILKVTANTETLQ